MNPFKGLGAALLTGVLILVLMRVSTINSAVVIGSLLIVAISLTTYLASVRRRRRDRRIAGG